MINSFVNSSPKKPHRRKIPGLADKRSITLRYKRDKYSRSSHKLASTSRADGVRQTNSFSIFSSLRTQSSASVRTESSIRKSSSSSNRARTLSEDTASRPTLMEWLGLRNRTLHWHFITKHPLSTVIKIKMVTKIRSFKKSCKILL